MCLRVPLLIAHPESPFKGQHYRDPVELVDVFPTVKDLLGAPFNRKVVYKGVKDIPLQGKSIAPVVLGTHLYGRYFPAKAPRIHYKTTTSGAAALVQQDDPVVLMPQFERNYAFTQTARCAKIKDVSPNERSFVGKPQSVSSLTKKKTLRQVVWDDCNVDYKGQDEISLLGYSMRTPDYRYTAYFYYNRTSFLGRQVRVDVSQPPFQQELYDHKNETLRDFTHRETVNLAYKVAYSAIVSHLRQKIIRFIQSEAVFHKD